MALINQEAKEIHCKVVYYGPSLSGKTTNIQWVYQKTAAQGRSDLMEFNTNPERTMFFDFLPMDVGNIRGLRARFHLYTVPGQTALEYNRRMIIKNVDGIIFVADSQSERMDDNISSLKDMEKNLEQQGIEIKHLPLVIQYNKRDLPNAASVAELRTALNRFNAPDFEATAQIGRGVLESLSTVSKQIVTKLKGGEM